MNPSSNGWFKKLLKLAEKEKDCIISSKNELYHKLKSVGFIAVSMSSAIGAYHAGVEKDWWQGPQSCTSGSINGLTTDDLLEQIMTAPLVRCNDIPWQLFGISMAGWNMIISLALALLWFKALRLRLS